MPSHPPLYSASVPVFRHYLDRVARMAEAATPAMLDHRLADGFPARQHFATAAGFALRVACPLAGREVPGLPAALGPCLAVARATLGAMRAAEFEGAEARMIAHRAGLADLEQDGATFLHLFGMPNFLFHVTLGHAALRAGGMALGKADFDGLHQDPDGLAV